MDQKFIVFLIFFVNPTTTAIVAGMSGKSANEVKNLDHFSGGKLGLSPEHEKKIRPYSKMQGRGVLYSMYKGLKPRTFLVADGSLNKIRFMLRNKQTGSYFEVSKNVKNLNSGNWNTDAVVKILIHGFCPTPFRSYEQNMEGQKMYKIGQNYANLGKNYNIIIMDWTTFACSPVWEYHYAAGHTKTSGLELAKFLYTLKDTGKIANLDKVHLIGFSLGAQLAGVAGFSANYLTGSKVGRITGIDPAGPLFDIPGQDVVSMLDASDGQFVDVIHCNMPEKGASDPLYPDTSRLGTSVVSGHADFYPNGGSVQHGCSSLDDNVGCSHNKCPEIFADSISSGSTATLCGSWYDFTRGSCGGNSKVNMGENCPTSAKGKYYKY